MTLVRKDVTIKQPTLVLWFPYEGEPKAAITPDESALPQVLEWIGRAYPKYADLLGEFVSLATDGEF